MPNQIYKSTFRSKPRQRSDLRMILGKTFFTLKRYIDWLRHWKQFAKVDSAQQPLKYPVFTHQTPLIRILGPETMYLQHNKVTNLNLTLPCINGL